MKKIIILVALNLALSYTNTYAQIKNATIGKVKIYGNCGMCETTIEKAGNVANIASVDWNKDTKMATIRYDAKKTNQDEILKRIALAGYDSEKFLASTDVYDKLHGCCKYERNPLAIQTANMVDSKVVTTADTTHTMTTQLKLANQMTAVFNNYFAVKDALVQTNGSNAAENAQALQKSIVDVKMDKLPMDVHMVWMKVLPGLKEDAKQISDTKDATSQRSTFMSLSKNMYTLLKVAKTETPTYYQFCPMANAGKGANWLSKESDIKNPYYGSKMMTCGKVVEIIQ